MSQNLFNKIWVLHTVKILPTGQTPLFVGLHMIHEVTSPQALMRFGTQGIIGESFGEIFGGNCTALGIPAVMISTRAVAQLIQNEEQNPQTKITIDLETKTVAYNTKILALDIPESSPPTLIKGSWDTTAQLLVNQDAIENTAARLPYLNQYRSESPMDRS